MNAKGYIRLETRPGPAVIASLKGNRGKSPTQRAAAAGYPFPLAFLDALMPDLDGFAVAEEIKNDPSLAGATIMMLTSADRGGELTRCRELGIAAYLRKPVKQSELLDAILTAMGAIPSDAEASAARLGEPAPAVRRGHAPGRRTAGTGFARPASALGRLRR